MMMMMMMMMMCCFYLISFFEEIKHNSFFSLLLFALFEPINPHFHADDSFFSLFYNSLFGPADGPGTAVEATNTSISGMICSLAYKPLRLHAKQEKDNGEG